LYDSPTGGLDPITSTTIIDLIIKQRDVSKTSSLLVTHRLQDAFMLATHLFNKDTGEIAVLPQHQADPSTSFLVLHQGSLVFDGSTHELVNSDDAFLKKYLA
ncbi:MAG: organic solvent resistance ABC transporter ATP-binding protein, partial [Silvibacterium sp.]|nr:organic solvent resistance ABC transporter ATP-binding protein [Silvibacterium sp.]